MSLSAAELIRTDEAMTASKGNRMRAAEVLGIDPDTLRQRLRFQPSLHAKWYGRESNPAKEGDPKHEPQEALTIHRPNLPTPPDIEVANALDREDAIVARGVEALGLSGKELAVAKRWEKASGKHYNSVLQLISGGLASRVVSMEAEIQEITAELDAIKSNPTPEGRNREPMLRRDRIELMTIASKTVEQAQKAALTRAQIRHKMSGRDAKGKKPKGHLFIQAQNGSQVAVKMEAEENGNE